MDDDLVTLLSSWDSEDDQDTYADEEWYAMDQHIDKWSPLSWWDYISSEIVDCSSSVLIQSLWQLSYIVGFCFLCRSIHFVSQMLVTKYVKYRTVANWLNHTASLIIGIILLYHQFDESCQHILIFVSSIGMLFLLKPPRVPSGMDVNLWVTTIVIVCITMQLYCEWRMDAAIWHQIRGPVMIIIMKAISYASDLHAFTSLPPSFHSPFYRLLCWLGYAMCPAILIFGPWVSIVHYEQVTSTEPDSTDCERANTFSHLYRLAISVWHVIKCLGCSLLCVIWSTCVCHTILSGYDGITWLQAYVASQSFRFSHYFVSYASDAFATVYGFGWSNPSVHEFRPIRVTRLFPMELPRSLVDVVVSWNLPMHTWLKQYVYKPVRPRGQFSAILATYIASSLLHGLNFQLSAVLLSIGIFAYIEYLIRERLSVILDACIGSRPCSDQCNHSNKHNNIFVRFYNVGFGLLAVFHLAYLAVVFDASEEQLHGYSMRHVLTKWGNLNFCGHYVAFATYIFYILIS